MFVIGLISYNALCHTMLLEYRNICFVCTFEAYDKAIAHMLPYACVVNINECVQCCFKSILCSSEPAEPAVKAFNYWHDALPPFGILLYEHC